jgi:general secretion pathway protein D
MLIISDRASNVSRMVRIIERIDQTGDEEIDVIPMQHASAMEVVRIVNQLYTTAAAEGGGMPTVKMVADERTNSVLVSGERSQRLRLKTLVTHLDTPLEAGGDAQVRYLRYADAENRDQAPRADTGIVAAAAPGGVPGPVAPASGRRGRRRGQERDHLGDPQTNALV